MAAAAMPQFPLLSHHIKRAHVLLEGATVISHEAHDEHHQASSGAQQQQQQQISRTPPETISSGGRGQLRRPGRLDSRALQVRGAILLQVAGPAGGDPLLDMLPAQRILMFFAPLVRRGSSCSKENTLTEQRVCVIVNILPARPSTRPTLERIVDGGTNRVGGGVGVNGRLGRGRGGRTPLGIYTPSLPYPLFRFIPSPPYPPFLLYFPQGPLRPRRVASLVRVETHAGRGRGGRGLQLGLGGLWPGTGREGWFGWVSGATIKKCPFLPLTRDCPCQETTRPSMKQSC